MPTDRRQFLTALGSFALSVPVAAMASGCTTASFETNRQKVALLVPKSGRAAAVGANLERAAAVTMPKDDPFVELVVIDTGGDAASAAAAADEAVRGGAKIVLGPVFAAETQAAAAAVKGRVPLIAFTNDSSLANQEAFIFGVTPDQAVSAILGYAKAQGKRRIAIVTQPGEVSRRATASARRLAEQNGMSITAVVEAGGGSPARTLKSPDAVLIPFGGEGLIAAGEALKGSGIQLLGTEQWLGRDLAAREAFDGAWFAAPVPSDTFSQAFAAQRGATPGVLAGLVYDAINMARVLAASNEMTVAGVLRAGGFNGALGNFRFRADRSCERSLSILAFRNGEEQVIATSQQS